MSKEGIERRTNLRVPVATRVKYLHKDQEIILLTRNISEGGLYLQTEEPPFVGTEIALEISLPNTLTLVKGKAEVVWRQEGQGCGVRFTRMTAENRKMLIRFLQSVEKLNAAMADE